MGGLDTYLGESMALLTAITWAFAVILFKKSGEAVHPIGLNLFKNVLAGILLIPTAWLFGETLLRPVSLNEYLLLFISGALGIGVADTLFFKSLNALGAGRSAIVDCLYSPFIIGLSMLWLGETLSLWQFLGVTMIVSAVLSIMHERKRNTIDRRKVFLGILWGVLAMASMAVGIVMIKPLLEHSPLIWATEVRILGGLAVLAVVLLFHPSRWTIIASVGSSQRWVYTLAGSFVGAYLAMVLWLAGMKFTQASIASALNQTSNIFIFIFAAILLKEKITLLRLIAIILGVAGALLTTFG
jgi:drug/metabolite transporter (DMT)-like permease